MDTKDNDDGLKKFDETMKKFNVSLSGIEIIFTD